MGQYMIHKMCFFGPKKMHFMQIESVLQTKNRSEPAKNRFSVALVLIQTIIEHYCLEVLNLNILKIILSESSFLIHKKNVKKLILKYMYVHT